MSQGGREGAAWADDYDARAASLKIHVAMATTPSTRAVKLTMIDLRDKLVAEVSSRSSHSQTRSGQLTGPPLELKTHQILDDKLVTNVFRRFVFQNTSPSI